MQNAGTVLRQFYDAVIARDMARARAYLDDKMVFVGLFETYLNAETVVNMGNTMVVLPDDTELQDTLRNLDDIEGLLVFGVGLQEWLQAGGQLVQSLANDKKTI